MAVQKKYIAHLDLDCFFVSVERIFNPDLIGKPVVVGGSSTGRGVVSSASYEARTFGVRSAMPTGQALRLCPHLIVVRGRHGEYGKYSNKLYDRMCELAPVVERASIDEMYMDFTGCESLYRNDLPGFMKTIQAMVMKEFSLPCTIALASNKRLAKIATGTVKPAGVCSVEHGKEKEFLAPLPIEVIPGVGTKTEKLLKGYGFKVIADLQRCPLEQLVTILGEHGRDLYSVAQGKGTDELTPEWERKSISTEETFSHDISDREELSTILFTLVERVCSSTRGHGWKGRTVRLKLRYTDFTTLTREVTVPATNDDAVMFRAVQQLFRKAHTKRMAVRLLGVGLSHFVGDQEGELSLFPTDERRAQILNTVDKLKEKFGDDSIHTGAV